MNNAHLTLSPPAKVGRYRGSWPLRFAALCLGLSMLSCITTEDIFGLDETKLIAKVSGTVTLRMFESEPVTIDLSESSGDCWRDSWTENQYDRHMYQHNPSHLIVLYCLDASIYIQVGFPINKEAMQEWGSYVNSFVLTGEPGYSYRPENKYKEGCERFHVEGMDRAELLNEEQRETYLPIESRIFSELGGPVSAQHCIDVDIRVLIPQQEQEIPYDPKTKPMTENQRNQEKKLNSNSTEQEE